jgi:hypothetical protein
MLPLAAIVAALLGTLAHSAFGRIAGLALAFVLAFIALLQARLQPVLVLDDEGYSIEQGGKLRFTVSWREVKAVRAEPRERALYIDCGDPARNLLVPPARGYGFRFADTQVLYQRVLAAVGDRVQQVERLDDIKPRA